jgi:hypothetical protein
MKLSEKTINILKNFSNINQSIIVKPGSMLSTITEVRNLMAKAKVDEAFDKQFAIYELPKFLGVLSLFKEPEIEITDKVIKIFSGRQSIDYTLAEPSMIRSAPDRDINMPSADVEFDIKGEELASVLRSMSILELKELAVMGDGEKIYVKAVNPKNPLSDAVSIVVGETDKQFKAYVKQENFKLINTDYNVKITFKGMMQWTSKDITYWIAAESNSVFN